MITTQNVEEQLTINALGAHLHTLPAGKIFASTEDEFAPGYTHPTPGWLMTNTISSYLQDVFPGEYIVVDMRAVFVSPVPLQGQDLLSTCQEVIALDQPQYTWVTLLLKMCNAVAADRKHTVGITVAQAEAFLSLARDVDRDFVSH